MTTTMFIRGASTMRVQYHAFVPDPEDLTASNKIVLDGETYTITSSIYLNTADGEELHIVAGGNLFWVDERDNDEVYLFVMMPVFANIEDWDGYEDDDVL